VRILEKATLNAKDPGSVRGIFDVVRGMATCPSLGAVADVLNKLAACKDIEPVRCKERFFTAPSQGGWRDCMVCFVIKDDVNRHVCELQITHRDMLMARKGLPGHAVYNRVRNASELLEVLSTFCYTPTWTRASVVVCVYPACVRRKCSERAPCCTHPTDVCVPSYA
jgi:hypothetical protein